MITAGSRPDSRYEALALAFPEIPHDCFQQSDVRVGSTLSGMISGELACSKRGVGSHAWQIGNEETLSEGERYSLRGGFFATGKGSGESRKGQ